MERYQGKKVVIIGGTSGMGLATAKMLLNALLLTGLARNRKSLRKEEHLSHSSYATN